MGKNFQLELHDPLYFFSLSFACFVAHFVLHLDLCDFWTSFIFSPLRLS